MARAYRNDGGKQTVLAKQQIAQRTAGDEMGEDGNRCQNLDDRGARCRSEAQAQHAVFDAIVEDRWYLIDLCRRCGMGHAPNTEADDPAWDAGGVS